jgi:hypothetical protein
MAGPQTDNQSYPFCGSSNVIIDTLNYPSGKPAKYRVQCQGCLVSTGRYDREEQAWAAWNIRYAPEKTCAAVNEHLFFYEGAVYTGDPLKEIFFRRESGGAKRIGKAAGLSAYAACVRKAGAVR